MAFSLRRSREEVFLETYFHLISQFAFDKAKEYAEKEREVLKANLSSSWSLVIHSLCNFAHAEKTYFSLTFLGQKWFGWSKDNPRNLYSTLTQEFRKVDENVRQLEHAAGASSDPQEEQILAHICGQLGQFLTARQKTMDFYEQMTTMGSNRNMNYEDLVIVITEIIHYHQKNFHHPILSNIKSSFSFECDIIQHLLQAQILIQEWQFLPALVQLHEANAKLVSWGAPVLPNKEVKKSMFGSSSNKNSHLPALYQWILRYKGLLLSKFTLYFYDILSKQTNMSDMKSIIAKSTEDFVTKIVSFQKKSDAHNVSLVLDTHGLNHAYHGHGYHHHDTKTDPPHGLDSYPAIFSYPAERPGKHWPNVVMMINDKGTAHDTGPVTDKPLCFYDKAFQSTYFITRVEEPRISLVVVFETKKSEKDSYVNNFMTDITTQLKSSKLFAMLKPGSKG